MDLLCSNIRLWGWDSTDKSLMFVIEPRLLNRIAAEITEGDVSQVELLNTINAHDSQIQAIAHLFEAELDGGGVGGSLYTESLMQTLMAASSAQTVLYAPTQSSACCRKIFYPTVSVYIRLYSQPFG